MKKQQIKKSSRHSVYRAAAQLINTILHLVSNPTLGGYAQITRQAEELWELLQNHKQHDYNTKHPTKKDAIRLWERAKPAQIERAKTQTSKLMVTLPNEVFDRLVEIARQKDKGPATLVREIVTNWLRTQTKR